MNRGDIEKKLKKKRDARRASPVKSKAALQAGIPVNNESEYHKIILIVLSGLVPLVAYAILMYVVSNHEVDANRDYQNYAAIGYAFVTMTIGIPVYSAIWYAVVKRLVETAETKNPLPAYLAI